MTAKIKTLISSANLAICHVETPMSATDTGISGYPVFSTPHELADTIKDAGYEGCSVASNHSIDKGLQGVQDTLGALDRVGVAHAGTARNPEEANQIELHNVAGVTVAHLSYTYGTNGIPIPAGEPWIVNVIDVPSILAAAHRAKQLGARFVVVSLHWGNEYQVAPTAEQRAQAQQLLASPDVDLILGDHVHVVQPVEKIGDKYVVYGLGNLVSNQSPAAGLPASTQDGAILKAYVHQVGDRLVVDHVTYTPTYVQIGPYTIWPVAAALDDPSTPADLRPQLAASWRRTVANESSLPGHAEDALPEETPHSAP
jgi:poly-gamma-glutamate synthesis protein (capsule biosynthesis protein)